MRSRLPVKLRYLAVRQAANRNGGERLRQRRRDLHPNIAIHSRRIENAVTSGSLGSHIRRVVNILITSNILAIRLSFFPPLPSVFRDNCANEHKQHRRATCRNNGIKQKSVYPANKSDSTHSLAQITKRAFCRIISID